VKDLKPGIPFGNVCERPLGRYRLWHCALKTLGQYLIWHCVAKNY
jgi:hypothetical protein